MARRSSAEVRQLLLGAAGRVFTAKGYARATVDEIADAAGVSMSVAFRHFPTKGDLFREALLEPFSESMRTFADSWQRSFTEPIDEMQVMRELVTDLYDSIHGHEDAVKGLITVEDSLDEQTAGEIAAALDQIFDQLHQIAEQEAQRRGWFSGAETELTSRLLFCMVTSTVVYRRWYLPSGRDKVSRTRLIEHMTKLMLYGLRLSAAPESATGEDPPDGSRPARRLQPASTSPPLSRAISSRRP
jgi:AcrR family transcriptional regulator